MTMRNFVLLTVNFVGLYCTEFYDYELAEDDMTSGYIPGDYVIGALFPVHFFFDDDNFQCISINEYDGIQAVEAAFFAVDMINSDEDILPNLTLGIDIKDYCNSVEVVTLQTKKLVDKSISRSNATKDIFSNTQKEIHSPLIGIIGPDSSILSIEVQSILRFFSIVQIGYSEPILDLFEEKSQLYPYFMSIVPENVFMTEGIIKILEAFNWTYVSLVHSVDSFGLSGLRHFQKLASKRGICIADVIESDTLNTIDSGGISNVMPSYQQVDVIVCYDSSAHMNLLLHKIKSEEHLNKRFVIIGGDGWPPRRSNRQRYEELAVGELAISLKQSYIQQFDDYYLSRNLQNNKRNPWFEEFWENHFKCKIKSSADHSEYPNTCTGEEVLKEKYEQNPKIPYIIKSVYVLAHALHDMLKGGCTDVHKGALPMQNAFYKTCFKKYVQKVNFSFFGDQFNFKHERMPANIRYNIHNFQKTEDGSYDYVLVGDFTETELNRTSKKVLRLYSAPQFPGNKTIKSTCNEPCSPKHAKVLRKDKCCWDCVQCKPLEILGNSEQCLVCKQGFMSNENKTGCVPIPVKYTTWSDTQILIPLICSAFSILLISTIVLVFIRFRNTPVVQSSTKELCYVMFAGMLLANVNSFITVLSPSTVTCAAIRIIPAMSFAMMYAALLVKTNRVARILAISKKKYPNLNARFLSLRAQIIIMSVLISIEAGICMHSLHKNHPSPYMVYREKNHTYFGEEMCPLNEDIIIDTFLYIFMLLLVCTYYAIKTKHLPENFNETRSIAFAMYASILTDLAFTVAIYLGNEWRILILNLCASVNSLIMLITLFSPKLYIILWTPEKNNRIYFKTSSNIRSYFDSEIRSEGQEKSTHYNRFNGDSISLETTTTEISISRL